MITGLCGGWRRRQFGKSNEGNEARDGADGEPCRDGGNGSALHGRMTGAYGVFARMLPYLCWSTP